MLPETSSKSLRSAPTLTLGGQGGEEACLLLRPQVRQRCLGRADQGRQPVVHSYGPKLRLMKYDEPSKTDSNGGEFRSEQSDAPEAEHDVTGYLREEPVHTVSAACGLPGAEDPTPIEEREVERTNRTDLQKPIELVEICETGEGLRLIDRKLLNLLLYYASESIKKKGPGDGQLVFIARTKNLREDLGMRASSSNWQIRESMSRLSQQQLAFSEQHQLNFATPSRGAPIAVFEIGKGEGFLSWSFPPWLHLTPIAYNRYSKVDIEVGARFQSKYGLILYELTSMLVERRVPSWEYSVGELRDRLGIGRAGACSTQQPGKLEGWNALERRALTPGIHEINRYAHFTVEMFPRQSYRSRRIDAVRFVVTKKARVR